MTQVQSGLARLVCFCLFVLVIAPANMSAAVYANGGVRSNSITICFVGDALVSRPLRVQQILAYIREYQFVANIQFSFLGTCPPASTQPNGDAFFNGDIRIVIPATSVDATTPIPGRGCSGPSTADWKSFSNSPNDLPNLRACLYNLKLGDDPWNSTPYLNHTLHEFGHALGLAHEHERTDVDRTICNTPTFGGSLSTGFMTPYDRFSVMNYQFPSCGINGNYDNSGLSDWDRLAVHILYPEALQVAEFVGTTVVRTTDTIRLRSAWGARGANLTFVAQDFRWTISGNLASSSSTLTSTLLPGTYMLGFNHRDFLGRTYTYVGVLRVLPPTIYTQRVAAPIASRLPLL